MKKTKIGLMLLFTSSIQTFTVSFAQSQDQPPIQTESQFRELFITAAYSTLLGAAFGASLLPFSRSSTENNMRTITSGASVGFMLGSTYGLFLVIRNGLGIKPQPAPTRLDDPYYEPPIEGTYGHRKNDSVVSSDPSQIPSTALFSNAAGKINVSFPDLALSKDGISISLIHANF